MNGVTGRAWARQQDQFGGGNTAGGVLTGWPEFLLVNPNRYFFSTHAFGIQHFSRWSQQHEVQIRRAMRIRETFFHFPIRLRFPAQFRFSMQTSLLCIDLAYMAGIQDQRGLPNGRGHSSGSPPSPASIKSVLPPRQMDPCPLGRASIYAQGSVYFGPLPHPPWGDNTELSLQATTAAREREKLATVEDVRGPIRSQSTTIKTVVYLLRTIETLVQPT